MKNTEQLDKLTFDVGEFNLWFDPHEQRARAFAGFVDFFIIELVREFTGQIFFFDQFSNVRGDLIGIEICHVLHKMGRTHFSTDRAPTVVCEGGVEEKEGWRKRRGEEMSVSK